MCWSQLNHPNVMTLSRGLSIMMVASWLSSCVNDCRAPSDNVMTEAISKAKVSKEVKVSLWVFVQRKLNIGDLLQRRWPNCFISPNWCVMCIIKGEN